MVRDSVINVCLACDDNYAKYAGVVIASILSNADNLDELSFYILDGGITEENKENILKLKSIKNCDITFVNIDREMFKDYENIKTHKYITIAACYRLKIASLLPNVDKIIYFDCDTVVNTGLSGLFSVNLDNCLIAGVSDIKKKEVIKNPYYVNSGMLIMNLNEIRQTKTEEQFLEYVKSNANTITKGDQEIINEVCKGKIKLVDSSWNVQVSNFTNRSSYIINPKVIHYVSSNKPWKFGSYSYFKNYWFKYLQLTPWAISEEEKDYWYRKNQTASIIAYLKYRPLFFLRPRFYKALYCTYLKQIINSLLYIKSYKETHYLINLFGIKIKLSKPEYFFKRRKNPYYYYKKHQLDITKLPQATGQIRNIQLANLAILRELDYVCKQNGIKYWLDFGTLLGAVRHKGYIPWDDDIDVGMLRDDYNKIIHAFNTTTRNSDLYAQKYMDDTNNVLIKIKHKHCKHIFVDIFPYDYCAKINDENEKLNITQKIKQSRKQIANSETKISIDELLAKCEDIKQQILNPPHGESDLVYGLEYNHHWKNWIHSYYNIFPLKDIEFEGEIFPAMNKPCAYLKDVYTDYMSYPKKISMGHSMYVKLPEDEAIIISKLANAKENLNKKTVLTYGTFDVLHYGHINLLKRAKELGDYLIVALSTDEFNKLKHKKSYYTYEQRKMILEACRYVDEIIPENNWEQKISDVQKYNVDTFVMGDDWKGKFDYLKEYCNVVYLPRTPNVSSTETKEYINKNLNALPYHTPKVSVVIPVYNVGKFLTRCLDSIVKQTLKDIEIICVNDGSTDNSLDILNKYAKKDKRIKVISQKNKGISAARNTGLSHSAGEYVSFIDSDDWVSLNFLEKLYESAIQNDADIACSTIVRSKKHSKTPLLKYINKICTDDFEKKLELCDIPTYCYVWNKIYKRQSLLDSGLKFEEGRIYEDVLFTPYILFKTENMVTVPGARYYYFRHKNSLVKKQSKNAQDDFIYANKKMYKFFKEHNIDVSEWETKTDKIKLFGLTIFKTITKRDKKENVLLNCIHWRGNNA